jgi:glutamyl/glutaminyl-tRNA synthetase
VKLHTRLAPTPSGLLHLGNAWSFTLTWLAARVTGGTVRLRIDDLDAARVQDEYLDDVFASLQWLGLDRDAGPRDAREFKAFDSQRLRLETYHEAVRRQLIPGGHVYACACSRAHIRAAGPRYPGTCRDLGTSLARFYDESPADMAGCALRFRVPPGPVAQREADGGTSWLHPSRDMGDFVVVRRDRAPAYQLASVVDDHAHGVNFVVRGQDLMPSTGAQLALAAALGWRDFGTVRFWHHPLILNDRNEKLSKSRGAESLAALRERFPDPAPVFQWFACALGLPGDHARTVRTAADLRRMVAASAPFPPALTPSGPLYWSDFHRFLAESGYG